MLKAFRDFLTGKRSLNVERMNWFAGWNRAEMLWKACFGIKVGLFLFHPESFPMMKRMKEGATLDWDGFLVVWLLPQDLNI